MKTRRTVIAELGRAVKALSFEDKKAAMLRGEWRVAFDQGVMQALAWVAGKAEPPMKGYELRLLARLRKKGAV